MRHALVEKRIDGINRWLERLKQSYTSGAMENALMDAECAKADLEILRADVWNKIQPRESDKNKFILRTVNFSKIAFLTLIIVLLAVFPISKEIPVAPLKEDKNKIVLAEPIQIIYEHESKYETPKPVQTVAKVNNNVNNNVAKPKRSVIQAETVKNLKPEKPAKLEKAEKRVAYDDIFSLIQTGQRALKNNESVVKIK
ncbi:MAG: hypothetical protein IJP96_06715 [Synergistaceae bacterium]|nr:hypothetical protein [Synergistaceae bacterium]